MADEKNSRRALKALDAALEVLKAHGTRKRKTDAIQVNSGDMFMTLGQAQSFLSVALNEGKSLTELAEINAIPQSTLSRHLLDLGIQDRNRRPGFGLVIGDTDPMELRRKLYKLTDKGRRMKAQLIKSIADI